jgi:hypothetical protein
MFEVLVFGEEWEVVLETNCSYPDVVGVEGSAYVTEICRISVFGACRNSLSKAWFAAVREP